MAPDRWWLHMDTLYMLHLSGYPFQPDDLPWETWLDLGQYKAMHEAMKWATPA